MPRHSEMDYGHEKEHCDDCWDAHIQEKRHREMVEALHSTVIERKTEYIFQPKAYEKEKKQPSKGGMTIEPRRNNPRLDIPKSI